MITLGFRTGDAVVDGAIADLLDLLERLDAGCVRSAYLFGSHTEGEAMPGSDIDLFLAPGTVRPSRGPATIIEGKRGVHFDFNVIDVRSFAQPGAELQAVTFKHNSQLLLGIDDRPEVPDPPWPAYSAEVATQATRGMVLVRGHSALSPSLDFPDPIAEFFGYTRVHKPSWYPEGQSEGTKELLAAASWLCGLALVRESGEFVTSKIAALRRYAGMGARWSSLVGELHEIARGAWAGAVPTTEPDRTRLRAVCRDYLTFEQHMMSPL